MKLQRILAIAAAVLLIALVTQIGLRYRSKSAPQMIAMWKDKPESVEAAHQLAEHVVLGQVVKVQHADDIVTRIPDEPGGVDRIPVEVVTLRVEKRYKGEGGETIQLFHTGHSDAPSPARRPPPPGPPPERPKEGAVERNQAPTGMEAEVSTMSSLLHDDPGYQMGERYMLFVRKGPRLTVGGAPVETQGIVSPEGRYRVSRDNRLEPVTPHGFAGRLKGQGLQQVEEVIGRIPKGK